MESLVKNEVIKLFNNKAKDGIERIKKWCEENNENFAKEMAKFFHEEKNNLNLEFIGDYLGTGGEDNEKVLENFVNQFNLGGKDYLESLRGFLQSFKLPGEAQKIDRLVESFGSKYYEDNLNQEIKGKDAAYILAFQVIMLNTDFHNSSIPDSKKMTFEQLKNNLKSTNNGRNFDENFLKKIYDEIKVKPFELNFVETAPGYEIKDISSSNDKTFKELNNFLEEKTDIKSVFSKFNNDNLNAEHRQPKSWISKFTGYEGSIIIKNAVGSVEIQIYKPNILSKWFLGEKSKIIVQPLNEKGNQPTEQSLKLAAEIMASFETKATNIEATYDYLKEELKNRYENALKSELTQANSVVELQQKIKEVTKNIQKHEEQTPDTSSKPLNPEKIFEDLKQAKLGVSPVIEKFSKSAERKKISSFVDELACKITQRKQNTDTLKNEKEEPIIQINNHEKRLEDLNHRRQELQKKKCELEEKKDFDIPREEKWKIIAELEALSNQFKAIEKEQNLIKEAFQRESQFNKNNVSSIMKKEPMTAADRQNQGAMDAIRRLKEDKQKQLLQQAEQQVQKTPVSSSGIPPIPPPMPRTQGVKGDRTPPPPPPFAPPSKKSTTKAIADFANISENVKQQVDNNIKKDSENTRQTNIVAKYNQDELRKVLEAHKKKNGLEI